MRPTGPDGNTAGFISIDKTIRKPQTAEQSFTRQLQEAEKKATKAHLPFARHVAREDFQEYFEAQAKLSLKNNGFVKPEDIKPIKMNWDKYSNLENFKVIEEKEVHDAHLSKRHNKQVMLKTTKYNFKTDKRFKYTVMEEPMQAVNRTK